MFIPHTPTERDEMLKVVGKKSLEDLFSNIPERFRFPKLDLPVPVSEMEAEEQFADLANANYSADQMICFLGAGAYNHYIPAAVDMMLRRGDFFTAYTPYQPEISQGTLQAIFEYQSLIANLTGMDVSNASHYDGATAAGEACLSAFHHFRGKRTKIILSGALHPHYRETIHTYLCGFDDIQLIEAGLADDVSYPSQLAEMVDNQTSLVLVQYPDFLGTVHDFSVLGKRVHEYGGLLAVSANPMALGLLRPPSEFGADFVVGEGQPLGIPMSFGGPYLGFFATRNELIRKISGRLVGETDDHAGRRGYVLTLTAREQHIRREKATSNICTNQGLMALAATIYLSLLGKNGLTEVANLCFQKAHYAAQTINKIPGYHVNSKAEFFNEFMVKCPKDPKEINEFLLDEGILGGLPLGEYYPSLKDYMLIAVTEKNSRESIDLLAELLEEAANV
jgi:glycine dehydrogenase subunit 1